MLMNAPLPPKNTEKILLVQMGHMNPQNPQDWY